MPQLTFWSWQFNASFLSQAELASYDDLCVSLAVRAPEGWTVGLMVKAHSGPYWQNRWDTHPLAIAGPRDLDELRLAGERNRVALGVWGESRQNAAKSGAIAGAAALAGGYYCIDLEPYQDFGLRVAPDWPESVTVEDAHAFWEGVRGAGYSGQVGASVVPLPSGLEPFGAGGLWAWLSEASYIHPQLYYDVQPLLAPDRAVPWLESRLARIGLTRPILPIFDGETYREQLDATKWPEGIDVWRI